MVNRQAVMGGADESVEWQPARLVPMEQLLAHLSDHPLYSPRKAAQIYGAHQIVRVMPCSEGEQCPCGEDAVHVHPEDARRVRHGWGECGKPLVCKTLILTD